MSYRRTDVELRGGLPAVNVKVYGSVWDVKLPLGLGGYSDDGGITVKDAMTDEGFSAEWIEENVSESALDDCFWAACEDGWEELAALACEVFAGADFVDIERDGRSGGWCVVRGLDDVDCWDAIMLSKWRAFERRAKAIAADIPRAVVDLVYYNVWMREARG